MFVLALAGAFAAEALVDATATTVRPCEDVPRCATLLADASRLIPPTGPGDVLTFTVRVDLTTVEQLKAEDRLVVIVSVPRSALQRQDTTSPATVPLTPPWIGYDLPVDTGTVIYSDHTTLTLLYDPVPRIDVTQVTSRFHTAIVALGFRETFSSDDAELVTRTYDRGGTALTLSVMRASDFVTVSITQMD